MAHYHYPHSAGPPICYCVYSWTNLLVFRLWPWLLFPDGQFPIHLTRIQVEKDHSFLEQADIDALIRRLNILNRCADKMDEIRHLVIPPILCI